MFKKSLISLLSITLCAPLFAGENVGPGGLRQTADLLRGSHVAQSAPLKIKPNIIEDQIDAQSMVLPVAGSVAGDLGTFFRSDLTLTNNRTVSQRVRLTWLPQGVSASGSDTFITIPADTVQYFDNFVFTLLGKSGLGGVEITTVDSGGSFDAAGRLDAFTRIWTNQPSSSGTVSQSFSPLPTINFDGNKPAYMLGLRHGSGFRTNVGIVNLSGTTHTFRIAAVSATTGLSRQFEMTIPGNSMNQTRIPDDNYGPVYVVVVPPDGTNPDWWTYGVSVDNLTGDGWVSIGVPLVTTD